MATATYRFIVPGRYIGQTITVFDQATSAQVASGAVGSDGSCSVALTQGDYYATTADGRYVDADTSGASSSDAANTSSAALSATFAAPTVLMVGAGIDPTGAADSTAAIQAKLTAAPAGAEVVFPQGTFKVTTLTAPVQVHIRGVGGGANRAALTAGTTILSASTSANCLILTGHGSSVRNLALRDADRANRTAGAGIKVTAGDFTRIEDVDIRGFWIGLDVINGWYWKLTNSTIVGPRQYGVQCANNSNGDLGDSSIMGCNILADTYTAAAGIHYISGGGFKMANTKINQTDTDTVNGVWVKGIHAEVPSGVVTGQWQVTNCSIENYTTNAIHFVSTGGSYGNIMLSNIQTGSYLGQTVQEAFLFDSGTGALSNISLHRIHSQRLPFVSGGSNIPQVRMVNVSGVSLHGLKAYGFKPNPVVLTGCTLRDYDPQTSDYQFSGSGDLTNATGAYALMGGADRYVSAQVGDYLTASVTLTMDTGATLGTLNFRFAFQGTSTSNVDVGKHTETAVGQYSTTFRAIRKVVAGDLRTDGQCRVLPYFYKTGAGTATVLNSAGIVPTFKVEVATYAD